MEKENTLLDLFRNTLELNKQYLNKGFKVFNKLSQPDQRNDLLVFRPKLYTRTLSQLMKVNLEYYNKMMEVGLTMANELLSGDHGDQASDKTASEPSFTLEATGQPGGKEMLQFILENTEPKTVECELKHTSFAFLNEPEKDVNIKCIFKPQKFTQQPGDSMKVSIALQIPKTIIPGSYISDVSVIGFEPSFFRIILTVSSPDTKSPNGKSSEKKPK